MRHEGSPWWMKLKRRKRCNDLLELAERRPERGRQSSVAIAVAARRATISRTRRAWPRHSIKMITFTALGDQGARHGQTDLLHQLLQPRVCAANQIPRAPLRCPLGAPCGWHLGRSSAWHHAPARDDAVGPQAQRGAPGRPSTPLGSGAHAHVSRHCWRAVRTVSPGSGPCRGCEAIRRAAH